MVSILKLSAMKDGSVLKCRLINAQVEPNKVKNAVEYAKLYKAGLDQLEPYERIDLIIDCRGGAMESALGVSDALEDTKRPVRVLIANFCGSSATLPAFYCPNVESVSIVPTGKVNVHMPVITRFIRKAGSSVWRMVERMGNASSVHLLMGCYAARTGKTRRQAREWMEANATFDARQAVEVGFCDRVIERHEWEQEGNNE